MSGFREWLTSFADRTTVDLFDTTGDRIVRTHLKGREGDRRLLRRSPAMEKAMIDVVTAGLDNSEWTGLLYVMGWGQPDAIRPLYIGKAGRWGKTEGKVSANLVRIDGNRSKFARWGDGCDYHIGDLSHALFGWNAYRPPRAKYDRWAEMLFQDRDPPRLRQRTRLVLIPWFRTSTGPLGSRVPLEVAEEEAIDLALSEFETLVLNVRGEVWWDQQASAEAQPFESTPANPIVYVETVEQLRESVDAIADAEVIGLDVETALYTGELALVQIATPARTYLIDAVVLPSIAELSGILSSSKIIKVIHNASFERRVLGELGLAVEPVFDTLRESRTLRPRADSHSLESVCRRELGRTLDKGPQRSNWLMRPLSERQVAYAAIDAEVLVSLYQRMSTALESLPFDG